MFIDFIITFCIIFFKKLCKNKKGSVKFFSPLGTYDFFKRSSIIYYNKAALQAGSDDIITMAENENLQGHANSIKFRV